jgi:hypothetical protein
MEVAIKETTSLWSTRGVVHIEGITYDDEVVYLEIDARQLYNDIPSLYTMSKQAISEDDQQIRLQTLEFVDQLRKDLQTSVKTDTQG